MKLCQIRRHKNIKPLLGFCLLLTLSSSIFQISYLSLLLLIKKLPMLSEVEDNSNSRSNSIVDDNATNFVVESGFSERTNWRRFCEFEYSKQINKTDCYKLLTTYVKSKPAWYFLGDSQMGFLFRHLHYPYETKYSRHVRPRSKRCGFLNYIGVERRSTWVPPNKDIGQGPSVFGLSHPWCSDVHAHDNWMVQSTQTNFREYLVVEYSNDVEQQTPYSNTTQQTVILYLKKQLEVKQLGIEESVCVVNTGAHEFNALKHKNESEALDLYLKNVKYYLSLLDHVCGYIIWVGTSSVRGDIQSPQRNETLLVWNEAIKSSLTNWFPDKSFFISVWNHSLVHDDERKDNIHFTDLYYEEFGSLFASLM